MLPRKGRVRDISAGIAKEGRKYGGFAGPDPPSGHPDLAEGVLSAMR